MWLCSDTICDLGGASELANYGEYSGAPSESQTYEYAKTIIKLMTEGDPHPQGKNWLIFVVEPLFDFSVQEQGWKLTYVKSTLQGEFPDVLYVT